MGMMEFKEDRVVITGFSNYKENKRFFWGGVLVLKGLHIMVQLQLLQHYWLEHRLGLL